jgi:hypothetical protein
MKTTRIAGGLAVLGLAAGVSACGSSSSSSSSSSAAAGASGLSRAELAAKANMICATAKAQSGTITAPANIGADAAAAAAYFDKIFPITDAETKEIQALQPAPAAAADWQSFVAAQVAADQLLLRLKTNADAKNPKGLADLAKVQPAGQKVAAAATKVGATTCASG